MSDVYFSRKRGATPKLSKSAGKRHKKMSSADLRAKALSDPDNPPLTPKQLDRMVLAREVRLVREKTGMSQPQFAARFHISLARLRDYEQARSEPDFIVRIFLRIIRDDPKEADRLVKVVQREEAALGA